MAIINVNVPIISSPAVKTASTILNVVPSSASPSLVSSVRPLISSTIPTIPSPNISIPSARNLASSITQKISIKDPQNIEISFAGSGLCGILSVTKKQFFSQNVVPKLQSLVPKFSPGLIVNLGAISAAVGIVNAAKSAASGGSIVSEITNQVTGAVVQVGSIVAQSAKINASTTVAGVTISASNSSTG